MHRNEVFEGGGAPFEGDRTIWVRSIPDGARLHSAVLTLTPVAAAGTPLFEETITFDGAVGGLGATQSRNGVATEPWTELDLHQRRTVTRVVGGGLTGAQVQVDLGGLYARVNVVGAPMGPDDDPFVLGSDGALPGLTASKFKFTSASSPSVSQLTLRSTPSNLVTRAGAEPAFWARPGELAAPVSTPDVAVALRAALSTAEVAGGFYQLPIVIHSDTLCRLDIALAVDFTVERTALPGGLAETTVTYGHSGAPPAPVTTLTVPSGGRLVPTAARARAVGAFQATRIGYGPVGPVVPAGSLPLTAGQSLAVPVTVAADSDATAVDLLLAATTPNARLQLDVVADTDGKPWNEPLLPRPVPVAIEHGDDAGPHWVSVALPATFRFTAGTRYWLTLQVEFGAAAWSVLAATTSPATQQSQDGGLSWRQAVAPGVAAADALLRLRVVPATFTMPVQLAVGEGTAARRISLDRFAPLGRVEIDLNAPEVIDGINAAVAVAEGDRCPTGEHVRNGDFARWTRTADQPTGARTLYAGFRVRRVAVAPDGCTAFVAGGDEPEDDVVPAAVASSPILVRVAGVDVLTDTVGAPTAALEVGRELTSLAADPAGRYCYAVLGGTQLLVADRQTGATTLPEPSQFWMTAMVVSTDGATLYLVGRVSTKEADTGVLSAVSAADVRADQDVAGPQVTLPGPPVDAVLNPNTSTLWVLTNDSESCTLVAVRLPQLSLTGPPIQVSSGATRCAVSASGSVLAAVHPESGLLSVVETITGRSRALDLSEYGDTPNPAAVAVSADGAYAFVALAGAGAVALVDLARLRVLRRIPVGAQPSDCALTPDGERLYVADALPTDDEDDGRPDSFTVLTIGTLVPQDWVVTAGTVGPVCRPPGGHAAAVGEFAGDETDAPATAALAQVMPVSPGCPYELTFLARASADGATAELHWRGAGCAVERVDTVPVAPEPQQASKNAPGPAALRPHRARVDAPAGASQVELRFRAPAGVVATVDGVSLHTATSVLPNSDLSIVGDVLVGWEIQPPAPAGFVATTAAGEVVLHNDAAVAVSVSQRGEVRPRETYRLTIDAGTTPPVEPSVDVAWLPAGPVASVPLPAGASRPRVVVLEAPDGAGEVDLRLVLPPGAELRLRGVALDVLASTRLPVSFVAESPGELTIIDWQVAYEVDETPRVPPVPAGGLCRPGRPEPIPGETPSDRCYCATCHGEHDMADPVPSAAASVPATRFTCTNCGSSVTMPGVVTDRPAGGPVRLAARPEPAARPGPPAASSLPLETVTGIGRATARLLNEIGVVGLVDLARTPVERLTSLPRVNRATARSWIDQARSLSGGG